MSIKIEIEVSERVEGDIIDSFKKVTKEIEMTEDELIGAIVDDSIGYASPKHARDHVEDYKNGKERAYCERGRAIYKGNLEKLIKSAVKHWQFLNDEKKERILDNVEQWKKIEKKDGIASQGISMMYPTNY